MISLEEVEKTILELEGKDTSFAVCEKLSYLYIVRDHIKPAGRIDTNGTSEFMRTISKKETVDVLKVLDELMQTIAVVQPKLYEAAIRQLSSL